MLKKIIVVLIFVFSIVGFSQNKQYPLKHLSTAEGLSQSSVIAITQDKLGQMWFGTRDGLNKYDGHKFTIYRTISNDSTSISNNDILSILEDKEGYIWVGTYNGLNKYNPKTNTFQRFYHTNNTNSLSNNTIWSLAEVSDKEIWIGTSNGLSVYNKETNTFSTSYYQKNSLNSLAGNQILSLLKSNDNKIWVGTNAGLSSFVKVDKGFRTFYNYRVSKNQLPTSSTIQDLIEDDNGNILIASKENGVLKLNKQTKQITTYFNNEIASKITKDVRSLNFDNSGALWIGSYDGLFVYNKNNKLFTLKNSIYNNKSLSKNSVKSIFKDKKGSIWIGTYYGGINIWDKANANFKNFSETTIPKGLSYNVVSAIEKYNNSLFFATEGQGITVVNLKTENVSYISKNNYSKLPHNNIKALYIDDNYLWIGTVNKGVVKYNLNNKSIVEDKITKSLKPILGDIGVYAIHKDDFGNLYFGTFGEGVVVYNQNLNTIQQFNNNVLNRNSLSSNLVRALTIDSKNNIWVGTQNGLNKINTSKIIERFFYDNKLQSGDDIATIFEDENYNIWVGTRSKGLFKLSENRFVKILLIGKNGAISNVHSLHQEKDNLWISTNEGIVKYNIKTKTSIVYNQTDGLISDEFNDNASIKINTSEFYFGGPKGVTSFNTALLQKNNYTPQVLITDFKLRSKTNEKKEPTSSVLFTKNLDLAFDEGSFNIEFAIPNYINSKNNSYKYRLIGLEKDWILTDNNEASYTIQNPGEYTFEVKGANSDGVWNQEPTTLLINVAPAPWRSWWAFLIYAFIIALALYFLISIQQSKTKLKLELELEHKENEKIEEANKAKLEFFTNVSHEFRTPLTLILGPLHQILEDYKGSSKMYKKLLVIENSAKHLLLLINRLMDFRKLEKNLFKLEAAEGNIVKFLKEIYLSFTEYANDGDYEYDFHTTDDEILVYYDRYKLERVFYNLISNAFRYTPKGGKIVLRVKAENEKIIIAVEDSGLGVSAENQEKIFDRFFEVKTNNTQQNYNKGTGIGLSIAKNIVKLHKGSIGVKDNLNQKGSIFYVELPLGKNHLDESEIIKDFKFSDDVSQYATQLSEANIVLEDDLSDSILDSEKPTILVVEDNKPLRKFMKNLLKENYNVLEAENGKIALKMAIKNQPNLIVSDVVMPIMVGTELCSEIKNNIKTSHIPVILLTSRTSLIYKLDGLEKGADDYISKPFNVNEFKLRIHNILKSSDRLKEKFTGENSLLSNEVIVSSLDEKLYKKALEIVESNISNEDFDIPFFCSELGVSRTMLFIKIKAWTNFTPNDFIQHFRMKRAAQLLEQGKINISEVSYKVGFKNPKYFSKCFLKKYGETPSQYSNKFTDFETEQ